VTTLKLTALIGLLSAFLLACGAGSDRPPGIWKLPADAHPALLDPSLAAETAPDRYRVHLATTKGDVFIEVHRDWAPNGADRFYNLVQIGFFDEAAFFTVNQPITAQFGISPYPTVTEVWDPLKIPDDPVRKSNTRGRITGAKSPQPDSRSTQFFINLGNLEQMDPYDFAPFGDVVEGMEVLDALYGGYGNAPPQGDGPIQNTISQYGNVYLADRFPKLDAIVTARVISP